MISAHMYNLILTAEETQVNRNFRSVIILCGFAALIMLIVAGKLFYDRVIGPKIDEIESGAPKQKKKKKKNNNSNAKTGKVNKANTNTKNNDIDESDDSEEEEDTFAFEYASIEDDEEDAATEDIDTNDEGDAD